MTEKTAIQSLVVTACAGVTLGLLGVWGWELGGHELGQTMRIGGLTAGVVVALAGMCLLSRGRGQQQQTANQFIDLLCETPTQKLCDEFACPLPELDDRDPQSVTLNRVKQRIVTLAGQCEQAERERAKVDVRLRRATIAQRQMQQIVEGLSEPVVAIDQYNEVLVANDSAEELLGFTLDRAETKAAASLLQCEELLSLLTDTGKRTTPTMRTAEFALSDETGNQHWFTATASSLRAADQTEGEPATQGAVAILRDVNDQKAIQKRHAEFVSAVSHEMKTPLAGIKAYVELLVDGDAEDEATREEFLEVVNSQADRLQRLIDNLLNLARIEAGVVEVNKKRQSLNEILEEALSVVQPAAEAKKIRLASDLSPMHLATLVDRDMILQSAINLLSNAVKYTPDGGAVSLRSRESDQQVHFEVEDTGVGLDEEDAARVFEKFYRVKKDSQMAPGTGLGLPLAKHIVEEVHGGELTVASELGRGSTFRVSLPKFKGND